MSVTAWLSVAVFLCAYTLIATERVDRVAAALGGAALMVLIGAADARTAFFSERTGIDWNVIFLLLGMMIIVGVLRGTGVFEYLAIWAAKRARGRPFRLMVLLVVITASVSALLDNVTTVLLIAPVTFLVCERLALPVAPFLIAEAMASNIGGTATLIGDPPNVIIAGRAGLTFNDFLLHMAPMTVVLVIVFVLLCRIMFRSVFVFRPDLAAEVMALDERAAIGDHRLLRRALSVLALVMVAFVLHHEPAVVALLGAGALVAVTGVGAQDAVRAVEWPTLVFLAGLFVMVGALVETGVIGQVSRLAVPVSSTMLMLWASAGLSAVVDNIPYAAAMSPVTADLVAAPGGEGQVLWWALAFGAGLGGNATAVGAAANVVVLGLAARNGTPITFWQFTRYGLVVTLVTVALVTPYLWFLG